MKWIAGAVGVVLVLVIILSSGGLRTKAKRFKEEPMVNVTLDRDTGESKRIAIEEYIKGVVAGEMGQLPASEGESRDWPEAAYAAQSILARSFALHFLNDEGVIDISTDVTEAQAYAAENITDAISRAVESTRGEVMMYKDEYVKAWFHSYAGGYTATAKEGLNHEWEPAFVKSVKLPENEFVPDKNKQWSTKIPIQTLMAALKAAGVDVGQITGVSVAERGPSGRAVLVEITGSSGTDQMHAAEFRLAADPEEMKSTLLTSFKVENDQLVASGVGFGHGVGLSQWDAYKMAKEGKSAEQIMTSFFKDVRFERLWD